MKTDIEQSIESIERMIKMWSKIEKIHFDNYAAGICIQKHDKLYAKAQMVVLALRHYKIALQES